MSLNDTVSAERVHIGFFGRRNAGKSSLVNAVTGQALSVVSDVRGTTTDPVQKAMELLPVGPVVILDTPGLDDEGELGLLRVEKARQALRKTDVAVLVVDAVLGLQPEDEAFLRQLESEKKPYLTVFNKADLVASVPENGLAVSASTGQGVHELKEALAALARPLTQQERLLVCDLLRPGLPVVLVTPIDKAAPKGRLILPQQQTLRELLDHGIPAFVCRETELEATLALLSAPPQLVITDSQAFRLVAKLVPESVPLTSFSILFARYKGDLELLVHGALHRSDALVQIVLLLLKLLDAGLKIPALLVAGVFRHRGGLLAELIHVLLERFALFFKRGALLAEAILQELVGGLAHIAVGGDAHQIDDADFSGRERGGGAGEADGQSHDGAADHERLLT